MRNLSDCKIKHHMHFPCLAGSYLFTLQWSLKRKCLYLKLAVIRLECNTLWKKVGSEVFVIYSTWLKTCKN